MKRALLLLAALLAALALGMLLLSRDPAPTLAFEPPLALASSAAAEASSVTLSYVELAASPHRSELPGATQVYGWLVREDDGQPVEGGVLRLRYHDYSHANETATEAHARATAGGHTPASSFRDIRVQDDGGWYADLPGKCWLESVEYSPTRAVNQATLDFDFAEGRRRALGSVHVAEPLPPPPETTLIQTAAALEAPLESGAVEITFRVSAGLEARGLVFDSQTAEPIADAHVILRSLRGAQPEGSTDARGAFVIRGIDPHELAPVNGVLRFLVAARGYQHVEREVPWESGQACLPAFKVVLVPHAR
jgi:hypothetical protein